MHLDEEGQAECPKSQSAYWKKISSGYYHTSWTKLIESIGVGFSFYKPQDVRVHLTQLRNSYYVITKRKFWDLRKPKGDSLTDFFYTAEKYIIFEDKCLPALVEYLSSGRYLDQIEIDQTAARLETMYKVLLSQKSEQIQVQVSGSSSEQNDIDTPIPGSELQEGNKQTSYISETPLIVKDQPIGLPVDTPLTTNKKLDLRTFEDLFNSSADLEKCIEALRQIDPPLINSEGKWIGDRRGKKSMIVAWCDAMIQNSYIYSAPLDRDLAKMLNKYIPGLNLEINDAGIFRQNTPTRRKYHPEFLALMPKKKLPT